MMVIYNAEKDLAYLLSTSYVAVLEEGVSTRLLFCYLKQRMSQQKERLHYLEEHDDGFEISQYDLKTRGPGELLGDKQSGLPAFMMGDIFKDMNILEETRRYAIR